MNFREAGVSVYPGNRRPDGTYVLDFRGLLFGLDTRYLATLLWGGRPLYVVEGQQVGIGNMGEPVLSSARIVGEVQPGEVHVLPDRHRFREVLKLWRARLRGDVVEATALLLSGNPGPEERSFVPPMAAFSWPFSGSVDEVVRGHLERWGMAEDWDRMRAEGERKQAEKRRQRLLLEEMERQADPFGTGPEKYAAGRTFSTSRDRTRRGWQPEPERGQWEWGSPWENSWM